MSGDPARRATWREDMATAFRAMWLPLIPSALIVVGGYFLWQYANERSTTLRDAMVESEAGRVQEEMGRALDQRAAALAQFVAARRPAAARDSAETDSEFARARLPFRAVATLDSALAVTGALPRGVRVTAVLDPAEDEARRAALRVVTEIPGPAPEYVTTTALAAGGRQLLVCEPIPPGGGPAGFVVGVSRIRDVYDEILTRTVARGFTIGVYEGPEIVYGTRLEDGGSGTENVREFTVTRDALLWRIEIWPGEELSRSFDSQVPLSLLLGAIALGLFVSLTLYLWRELQASETSNEAVASHEIREEGRD